MICNAGYLLLPFSPTFVPYMLTSICFSVLRYKAVRLTHYCAFMIQPLDKEYLDILQHFGDSEASSFSIHNLLQAGKGYGLAVGSWVGPYAMCRSWEVLARNQRETNDHGEQPLPMALYVVSGDEDGERGGAPVVCIEDASRRCSEFSRGLAAWTPLLLLVPLVLGLDKVNLRCVTFSRFYGII